MMKRRTFITLLGGAAAAWPLAARAQQKIPQVGVLLVEGPELMGPYREALRALGYIEGKTIEIEVRSAQGQAGRLPELAAELVRSKVDVIVAALTPAVTAARRATSDIPIIMAPAGDPVGTGLISSLARPGGNITGLSATAAEASAKNLELIREFVPGARRVGVIINANDPFSKPFLEQIQEGAKATGFEVHHIPVHGSDELEGAYAALARERSDAVIFQGSLPIPPQVSLALKYRLPSLSNQTNVAHAGALVGYGASVEERGREIAKYVDRILKGARPAELPVEQPTKFDLVINLKTAKALGLTVSPTLLARANEVIE
jgi:putative tryptophan/tyrosine transport system substrate-binding protein